MNLSICETLNPDLYREIVRRALEEDVGTGDVTTAATVPANLCAKGSLVVKSPCVLAGLAVAAETFRQLDPKVSFIYRRADGDQCQSGDRVADVSGSASALLTAERSALNFLQRMSGIATLSRNFVETSEGAIVVLDTRKTTPNLRVLEKYAVRVGGGENHRGSLGEGILIKDNHIRLAKGVAEALRRMKVTKPALPIEIEVQTLDELDCALANGAPRILVDNMSVLDIREAVRRSRGRAAIEISGGVTLNNMPEIATAGADYVSVGALTHSAEASDISFEIEAAR